MNAIEVEALTRRYGSRTVVDSIDLNVPAGTLHALLGPNGSGKTTVVRMLATLLRPTSGVARILGLDTICDAAQVKRNIGLVGQSHAVDPRLTGSENLIMFAKLGGHRTDSARAHASNMLERFGLTEAANRQVQTYSGGMRRRLDIIAGMIVRPAVLFLDEPTTGLDPHSRNEIYECVRSFIYEGTTVLLTTQYLAEAEQLADAVTILDAGRVITTGTPEGIVSKLGASVDIDIHDAARGDDVKRILGNLGGHRAEVSAAQCNSVTSLSFTFTDASVSLLPILRSLDTEGIEVVDIGRRRATLDDAFLALTGERTSA